MAQVAMIGATIAGTALSATGSVMAGREQSRAAAYERQQLQIQEEQSRTAAAQAETRRREDLTNALETIQAIRAGRGVGSGSPTGMAILNSVSDSEMRDMRTDRLNHLLKSDSARMAGVMAKNRGRTSLLSGFLGAGETVAGGISKAVGIYK